MGRLAPVSTWTDDGARPATDDVVGSCCRPRAGHRTSIFPFISDVHEPQAALPDRLPDTHRTTGREAIQADFVTFARVLVTW